MPPIFFFNIIFFLNQEQNDPKPLCIDPVQCANLQVAVHLYWSC